MSYAQDVFECVEPATGQKSTRIVGGETADPKDFPWQVALSGTFVGLCGGSLIGERYVLTAAHCVSESVNDQGLLNPNVELNVSLVDATGKIGDEARSVQRALIHERYNPDGPGQPFDIAIIQLAERFNVGVDGLMPIATFNSDQLFATPGTCSLVTGWGTIYSGGPTSEFLKKTAVPILAEDDCAASYPEENISNQHLCAGYQQGGKDSCQGDSGGPLMVRGGPRGWIQVGVVSWGYGCADEGYPGVYQRVGSLREWIDDTIRISEIGQ